MAVDEPRFGPVQLLLVGFETTERLQGHIAAEIFELRGRGLVRILDARLVHRTPEGKLTEFDLNQFLTDRPESTANPVARLLATNGGGGNGGFTPSEAFARTAGFALEDVRHLTDEIGPGEYAAVVLVEHLWAGRLQSTIREAGGKLLAQGLLTPEVVMLVGAELKAKADAEQAIEIAQATRAAALIDALETVAHRDRVPAEERVDAAAKVVRVLAANGFVDQTDAVAAIESLATAGLIEEATVQAALADAEDVLEQQRREPPDADARR